jgi:hypothetical protein
LLAGGWKIKRYLSLKGSKKLEQSWQQAESYSNKNNLQGVEESWGDDSNQAAQTYIFSSQARHNLYR